MRGGHNSGCPQKGFDADAKRLVMLELVQQNQLIQQHRGQNDQLGAPQAPDRNLPTPIESVLEQAVKRLNGLRTQLMKDESHLNTIIRMRIFAPPRGDQPPTATLTI